MKLKKFTKNKKQKQIVIGSIVGILLLIGGITLYRTFALYKEEKTFDALNGTVPDFVYKEEILNGAYPVLKSKTGEKLIPVQIDDNGKVTKADIKDKWYSYAEKKWANAVILVDGATEPKNDEEIPEENIESYFVWIPKYKYKLFNLGKYDSVDSSEPENKAQAIEIKFGLEDTEDNVTNENGETECKTPGISGESGKCDVGEWMTHPAFTAFPNSHGIWVGKFETGYNQNQDLNNVTLTSSWTEPNARKDENDSTKVIIKPNVYSWRNISVGNAYKTSYAYQRDLDSHMMKNTEWGAVAYLTQSIYGRCNNETCEEVRINNNGIYVTGYAAINPPIDGFNAYKDYKNVKPGEEANAEGNFKGSYDYKKLKSTLASTTNNYTGIYDMSGSAWEYVAAAFTNATNASDIHLENIELNQSGLNITEIEDEKYIDLYLHRNVNDYSGRILGDATGELGPFGIKKYYTENGRVSSWNEDYAYFVSEQSINPFMARGGPCSYGAGAGIFAFIHRPGQAGAINSFRIVLTPQ